MGAAMGGKKCFEARPWLAADLSPLPLHFFCAMLQGGSVLHLVLALRGGAGVSQ